MNRLVLCILTYLLMGKGLSYAQLHQIQQLEDPVGAVTFYETLKSEYITKDTKSFGLKGNVKSVKETITFQNSSEPLQIIRHEFLKNNSLSVEQIINLRYKSLINEYYYGKISNRLLKVISLDSSSTYSSKTTSSFDKYGFKFQEIHEYHESDPSKKDDKGIDDFDLEYQWNKNRDTVKLKYSYKIPSKDYNRAYDHSYFFKFNSDQKIISEISPNQPHIGIMYDSVYKLPIRIILKSPQFGVNSEPYTMRTISYNEQKQITKYSFIDLTIRNSFNYNSYSEFKYNGNQKLTSVSRVFSRIGGSPIDQLDSTVYEIQYLKYDELGNWTSKKITTGSTNEEYFYRREISYY